jgi:hypothetical protein
VFAVELFADRAGDGVMSGGFAEANALTGFASTALVGPLPFFEASALRVLRVFSGTNAGTPCTGGGALDSGVAVISRGSSTFGRSGGRGILRAVITTPAVKMTASARPNTQPFPIVDRVAARLTALPFRPTERDRGHAIEAAPARRRLNEIFLSARSTDSKYWID